MTVNPANFGVASAPGDLARLSAADMVAGYRAGRFDPVDVIDDTVSALRRTDDVCNIVVTDLYDEAVSAAKVIAQRYRKGVENRPLAGVPVTIKDLVFVAGKPAKAGAPSLAGFTPQVDAHVVRRLRDGGAIVTCKTTTCESGYKLTADSPVSGITRNPWSLDRTSGGSSGGAAVGVAAGCGPLAVGTDGVGSIRVPASFCGVFGIKPTFGLVSRAPGFFPPSWGSLAHTGPIARTVADASRLLEVIAGYDMRDAASLALEPQEYSRIPPSAKSLRVAFSVDFGYAPIDPQVRAAFAAAVDLLASAGAELVEVNFALDPQMLDKVLKPIAFTEQAASVGDRDQDAFVDSDDVFRAVLTRGLGYSGADYMAATHLRSRLRGRFVELFDTVDILLTPTVPVTAFAAGALGTSSIDGHPVDTHLGWSPFTWPVNLCGLPAATVPCGRDSSGLPIGLQMIAPWMRENSIIALAGAFEQAQPWALEWPPLKRR
jgi:aspartyl-tRNA(Asn)/glutamyl-tRNA(Gln) amidotransferase subunit A